MPQRPRDIDPLAEALLTRLQSYPAARHIVLGDYFALKHHHDYRITHDVDAWWAEESRESDREQVRAALKTVLESLASEQGQWREVFDRFPLSHSAAYHTFRFRFGWEPVPGRALRAGYELDDLREGRTDPCVLYT